MVWAATTNTYDIVEVGLLVKNIVSEIQGNTRMEQMLEK